MRYKINIKAFFNLKLEFKVNLQNLSKIYTLNVF
jgi:hypothetical protein